MDSLVPLTDHVARLETCSHGEKEQHSDGSRSATAAVEVLTVVSSILSKDLPMQELMLYNVDAWAKRRLLP